MTPIEPLPDEYDGLIVNNRIRAQLDRAIGGLKLLSPDPAVRMESAKALENTSQASLLPLIEKALAKESNSAIRRSLEQTKASLDIGNPDPEVRLAAAEMLSKSGHRTVKTLLLGALEKDASGNFIETDERVRDAAESALKKIERRLLISDWLGRLFTGVSLGSILMLVAPGLAITYGLLGVINMAHGEMLMIGAYATFVTQQLFRSYMPELFDWYLLAALPIAFVVAALVGMALERSVIR